MQEPAQKCGPAKTGPFDQVPMPMCWDKVARAMDYTSSHTTRDISVHLFSTLPLTETHSWWNTSAYKIIIVYLEAPLQFIIIMLLASLRDRSLHIVQLYTTLEIHSDCYLCIS